jgi:hypothetical protein
MLPTFWDKNVINPTNYINLTYCNILRINFASDTQTLSIYLTRSPDSSFDIKTDYGLDGLGSILLSTASRPNLSPKQPPIQLILGAISTRVKWPELEADPSHPSSAEVKNAGAIPPLPHMSSWHSA